VILRERHLFRGVLAFIVAAFAVGMVFCIAVGFLSRDRV
jgi:tetrahydromethanopterin S-methyltransferase subunit F